MQRPIAQWNPATQIWETDLVDLFSERQEPFSETWPTSGMTRSGRLLPLPASAHHTAASACSSLLSTPRASRGASTTEIAYALGGQRSNTDRTQGQVLLPTPTTQPSTGNGHARNLGKEVQLLPTPTAQAAKHSADDRGPGTLDDHNLWSVAARMGQDNLLPMPRATDGTKGGPNQRGSSGDLMLPSAVMDL